MAVDAQEIADRAAVKLKVSAALVLPYAEAAIAYVTEYTDPLSMDDPLVWELPAGNPQLEIGLELLTMRMWQDTPTPSGGISSFDDFTSGGFTPKNLYSHLDQYWVSVGAGHSGMFA